MGLDPEELVALAAHFQVTAGQLAAMTAELQGRLEQTNWRGPDADRCTTDFNATHAVALKAVISFLEDNASYIRATVDEQQQANAR
jgi:hypothetical protein